MDLHKGLYGAVFIIHVQNEARREFSPPGFNSIGPDHTTKDLQEGQGLPEDRLQMW